MNLTHVAAVAADAQSNLHALNVASRAGAPVTMVDALREVHRTRLMVCAEFFAECGAVNDAAFETRPELA